MFWVYPNTKPCDLISYIFAHIQWVIIQSLSPQKEECWDKLGKGDNYYGKFTDVSQTLFFLQETQAVFQMKNTEKCSEVDLFYLSTKLHQVRVLLILI